MRGDRLFRHRLALALGMTVADLMRRMPPSEYADWLAFGRQELIGDQREDFRHAMLMTLLANKDRGHRAPYRWQRFMPFWEEEEEDERESTPAEFARALGATA